MLLRFLLPVTAALAATSAAAALPKCPAVAPAPPLSAPCRQFYLDLRAPEPATPPPSTERIFCHSFYALSYSSARRNPVWTSYRLTDEMAGQSDRFGRRSRTFGRQAGLSVSQQPHHNDWQFPPFARGHMTPDNDAPTCETQADTYWVTNIVPQVSGFNSGRWSRLEVAVHRLAISEGEIFVVTGPIFDGSRPPMNGIAVPSAIFKALYVPSRRFALAFISTNESRTVCTIVPIAEVERRTGVDVFPSLSDSTKAQLPAMPAGWGRFPRQCTRTTNDP